LQLEPAKPPELYDVAADPGEETDVAADHPDIVKRCREIMKTARTESADWSTTQAIKKAAARKARKARSRKK
jgi:hypothetical protein